MRAPLLLAAALGLGLPVAASAQDVVFSPVWQQSDATTPSTKPTYFGANTERGFAAGVFNGTPTVVVVSRNGGLSFEQHDMTSGAVAATYEGTGAGQTFDASVVTGGTFALNDAAFGGGVLIGCNLTTSIATSAFKCYRWTSLAAAPTNVITFTDPSPGPATRVGDTFTLAEESTGLALYAAPSGTGADRIYKWTSTDAGATWTQANIPLQTALPQVSVPSVAPVGDGSFFVKGAGTGALQYSAAGALLRTIPTTVVPSGGTVTRHFTSGTWAFLAMFQYNATTDATPPAQTGQRVLVYRLDPARPDTAYAAGAFSLGNTANANGTGDLEMLTVNGQSVIAAMASNNGAAAFTAVVSTPAPTGQTLLVENFDYAAGIALGGATTPNPTTNWASHSGTPGQITVQPTGLTFASTPTYPAQTGGSIVLTSGSEDVSRTFAAQTSGSVYTSFLMNASSLPANGGSYFMHLGPATMGSAFRGRLWSKPDAAGTGYVLGVSTGGNTATWGTTSLSTGTTYLVVLRYDVVAGELNDAARLYVFPAGAAIGTEPGAAEVTAANDGVADPVGIGTVAFRQGTSGTPTGNTGTMTVDGLRVATAWSMLTTTATDRAARLASGLGLAIRGNASATPVLALTSDAPGTVSVEVFDVLGRRVAAHAVSAAPGMTADVALADLAAGVYVVRAVRGRAVATTPLVVR